MMQRFRSGVERVFAERCATWCLMALLLAPPAAFGQTSSISGTVTRTSDGAVLAGLGVNIYAQNEVYISGTTTAGNGSYSFQNLPAGLYKIRAGGETISGTFYVADFRALLPVQANEAVVVNFALGAGASVTGTVTSETGGTPLTGGSVQLLGPGGATPSTSPNGSGVFTFSQLPPGTYYAKTIGHTSHVDERYNNQPCEPSCNAALGTPIVVTSGSATTGIDFALADAPPPPDNGFIGGVVRSASSNAPLPSTSVQLFDSTGAFLSSTSTGGDGSYSFSQPPGTYFVKTNVSVFGPYRNVLYNNINCSVSCIPASGTPVVVTSNQVASQVNFALPLSGQITGVVTDATTGSPIAGVQLQAMRVNGEITGTTATAANGTYSLSVLAGTHFVRTTASVSSYRLELYNDISCVATCTVSGGTPVTVADGVVTGGINFALNPGGMISGTTTALSSGQPIAGIQVKVYTATGQLFQTTTSSGLGAYSLNAPAGTYFLTAGSSSHSTQLFNAMTCADLCAVTAGTPVVVSAGTTTTANFSLKNKGTLTGTVRDAATLDPISGLTIQIYNDNGVEVGATPSNSNGIYTYPLGEGSYRVVARASFRAYFDELYNDLPCPSSCNVLNGTPVLVNGGQTTNIDFDLTTAGNISGTITSTVTGQGLQGVAVLAYAADGTIVGSVGSGPGGIYTMVVKAGIAYVATSNSSINIGGANSNYVGTLYANLACLPVCLPTSGTPVVVTPGATTPGIDIAVAPGAMITGTVTDESNGQPIPALWLGLYAPNGQLLAVAITTSAGEYGFHQLPAGNFYVRTFNRGGYRNEIYNGQTVCSSNCAATSGSPVAVTPGQATTGIDFALSATTDLIQNGSFTNGTAGWALFATPTQDYLVSFVSNGTFRFTRMAPPAGTGNQAVIFQNTGVAIGSGTSILAEFDLGSIGTLRKRVSVLVHDSDFSDLAVCTFWIPAGPAQFLLARYGIRLVTTKAWTNATISFYAATATNGNLGSEALTIDDVSMQTIPGGALERVECIQPAGTRAPGGADGADLLVNGNFSSGMLTPGWGTFGQIQGDVTGGVFEFIKLPGAPAGVVLQPTGQTADTGGILTASFDLGNSSAVRKRVTVLLHDNDFSDLAACTFWLDPGQALGTFTMRLFTSKPWINATVSVYPATTGAETWIRLDNVTLKRTPGAMTTGTTCLEPAGTGGDQAGM